MNRDKEFVLETESQQLSKEEAEKGLLKKAEQNFNDFLITKELKYLAEMEECLEFFKILKGYTGLWDIRDQLKRDKGLYWKQIERFCCEL